MTGYAKLLVVKNGAAFDMSGLVSKVKWQGRKGSSARALQVEFVDDGGYRHERSGIDVEQGHQCIFCWKNEELFRGMFMSQERSRKKTMSVKAYDSGVYLANNKDTFNYTDKKASEIFADCCARFGIPCGAVADTGYRIPELPKPKTTPWDVIADALGLTFQATGVRYYPICRGDRLSLIERRENILQWVIETGVNLEEYSQAKSIEKIKTRIRLLSKEGAVLAEAADAALEKRLGVFQDVVQVSDEMNGGQLAELVNATLAENNKATQTLSVSALGLTEAVTGVGVFIDIKPLGISKTYYVEEDAHTFEGRSHGMSLKLSPAGDISAPKPQEERPAEEIKAGDEVDFAGGPHYASSTAGAPAGGARTAGKAKCTLVAKGAKHPYHLIGGPGGSNVYGWVDADLVSKQQNASGQA
jgi:hypothetical protein